MSVVNPSEYDVLVQDEIDKGFEFKLNPASSIELSFRNVNIWVEKKEGPPCKRRFSEKLILNYLTSQFKSGTATAILGSSGSGKTTLLNYLSSRMEQSVLKSNGELYINGNLVPSIKTIKHRTGFVNQFDILYPDLTAREHMVYTAKLSTIPNPEAKVQEILTMLGLERAGDTRVGNEVIRGISGGERKRTAIGIELVTDPGLLFLDEPTTGLDSKSALDVASVLKKLAENGRTVITTIHSPSAEIMAKFDKVICLCRGEIIFDGPPAEIVSHFQSIGFQVPPMTNPADFLMTIINEDDIRITSLREGKDLSDDEVKEKFQDRIELFVDKVKSSVPEPIIEKDKPISFADVQVQNNNANALANFCYVLTRCLKIYFRKPESFRTKLVQILGFCVFSIVLLHKTTDPKVNTQKAIQDKAGMAFNLATTMCFSGIFANLYTFIPALPTFRRESQNKLYGPLTFFFTHAFFEIPFQFVLTNVYVLVLFWTINMRHDSFKAYAEYVGLFTCTKFAAAGLGDLLSIGFKRIEVIIQSFSVIVIPLFLVSGFVANIKTITWHMIVYSYASFFRFTFQGVINIEFTDEVRADWIANCKVPFVNNGLLGVTEQMFLKNKARICDPRTNYEFFEGEAYLWNLLILLGQGVFFRVFAIIATYLFDRESNLKNDKTPAQLQPIIDKRMNMKHLRPETLAAEHPNANPSGKVLIAQNDEEKQAFANEYGNVD